MVQNSRAEATIVKANYFLDQLAPAIGNRPINDIEPFEVLAPLKRLEATGKHETAKKCRSFAGRVFRYGVATTRCKADPTSMLKGALVTPRATHYAAILEPSELGGLRCRKFLLNIIALQAIFGVCINRFDRKSRFGFSNWRQFTGA